MTQSISLPNPQKDLEFPLMKALELRRTKRSWIQEPLSLQDVSNLLWAGCGITREATPRSKRKRTAPSGTNSQTISIHVAMEEGCYRYNEDDHSLELRIPADIRAFLGTQKMMKSMPLGLVYVSDYSVLKRYVGTDPSRKLFVAGTETGFISQNVYLYCAAANLATAVLGLVDRDMLHSVMQLSDDEVVVYTQAVGRVPGPG